MTSRLDPTCRNCGAGADELHSIERAISWRYVNWERAEDGSWSRGDEWGDDVGDTDYESVGAACGRCYTETADPDELITTRAQYQRSHPVRSWLVERTRLVRPATYAPSRTLPDPEGRPDVTYYALGEQLTAEVSERETVTIRARNPWEAAELASENGMQGAKRDRYPWRAYAKDVRPAEQEEVVPA